jgi:hypothetical protein
VPYVNREGNAWVCWSCIGGRCSLCVNRSVRTTAEMQPCDCQHPDTPGWVLAAQKHQPPVVTEADTGPVPVIRQGRSYATPWHMHRKVS